VAAYIHPTRLGASVTGVGKHMTNMTLGLGALLGEDLQLLVTRTEWENFKQREGQSPLLKFKAHTIAGRRVLIEKTWATAGAPAAERWVGDVDWVYAPMEAYVPVRRARLAVTCHCMNWFEKSLPWYGAHGMARERWRWRWRTARLFRSPDALLLTVSNFSKERLVDLFDLPPERIAVVGNGVEPAYFAAGREPSVAPATDPPYVLVVGGLTVRKGGDRVLQAAEHLRRRGSDIRIYVAGRSEPSLDKAAAAHPNVRLLGYVGVRDGLPDLMRRSVAVYVPSRYETFGIPAAESMAAGAPTVVSEEGALAEVVGDGAVILHNGDPEQAADVFERLLTNEAYRSQVVERGLAASRRHTWTSCCERLMAALAGSDATVSRQSTQGIATPPAIATITTATPTNNCRKRYTSSIVITTYNRCEVLRNTCLQLRKLDPQPDEIIVCLDGCTDGTREMLAREFPDFTVIESPERLGSIPSRDRAFRLAASDLIVTLDDDSYPTDPDFLRRASDLVHAHPECAAFTFPEIRQHGMPADESLSSTSPGKYIRDFPNCAGVMLRECYGRDAEYATFFSHAYAEPDYCLQLYAAGHAVWFEPTLTVRHHFTPVERNMLARHHLNARNELWSVLMRCPFPQVLAVVPLRMARQLVFAMSRGLWWTLREPKWWFYALMGAPKCLKQRRPIPWRRYWAWVRLGRSPAENLVDLQRRFAFPSTDHANAGVGNAKTPAQSRAT